MSPPSACAAQSVPVATRARTYVDRTASAATSAVHHTGKKVAPIPPGLIPLASNFSSTAQVRFHFTFVDRMVQGAVMLMTSIGRDADV
jgi:hypothetical protein